MFIKILRTLNRIETIKHTTISNIYIKDLVFYEEAKREELIVFCRKNGISHLPDTDRITIHKLQKDKFEKVELTKDLVCNPYDRLFDLDTFSKFESGNHDYVLFVKENDSIKGVVHVVDYNNDFLNIEFFKASYRFERMLREFLVKNGRNNLSLLKWIEKKAPTNDHWKRRLNEVMPEDLSRSKELEQKRLDLKEFQTFYLNDLLMYAASEDIVSKKFKQNIEAVKQIRNWVAHNKDLTFRGNEANEIKEDGPLYKIDELKSFIENANKFFECYEELEFNRLRK